MTITTKPGKLLKQGPIATLEGGISYSSGDKFLFNGKQFVQLVSKPPKVVEASANLVDVMYPSGQPSRVIKYDNYRDSNGEFRFVNGNPTTVGINTGSIGPYDHVIIGYESEVSTDSVVFWTSAYIPVQYVRVDYGWDGLYWINIPTHEGNVTYEFDDSLRLNDTEESPSGLYKYTVDLGVSYTAKYWRIRSFLTTYCVTKTTNGSSVPVTTTSGLPSSITTSTSDMGTMKYFVSRTALLESGEFSGTTTYNQSYQRGSYRFIDNILFDLRDTDDTDVRTVASGSLVMNFKGTTSRCASSVPECVLRTIKYYKTGALTHSEEITTSPWDCTAACPADWHTTPEPTTPPWPVLVGESFSIITSSRCIEWATEEKVFASAVTNNLSFSVTMGSINTKDIYVAETAVSDLPIGVAVSSFYNIEVDYDLSINQPLLYSSVRYASKTSTSLTTATITSSYHTITNINPGDVFLYSYPMSVCQVGVISNSRPMFKFWESDGDAAATKELSVDNVYDVVYDRGDEVFYAICFNEDGGLGPEASDSFSADFYYTRWDVTGGFYVDTSRDGLVFTNTASGVSSSGNILSNYKSVSDFSVSAPVDVTLLSGTGYIGLYSSGATLNNVAAGVYCAGDWGEQITRTIVGINIEEYRNSSEDLFKVTNLFVSPTAVPEGRYTNTFVYDSSGWLYSREAEEGYDTGYNVYNVPIASTASSFISASGTYFDVNYSGAITYGNYVSFVTDKTVIDNIFTVSGIVLKLVHTDAAAHFSSSYEYVDVPAVDVGGGTFGLVGDTYKIGIVGRTDNVIDTLVSGVEFVGDYHWNIPSFKVVSLDNDGKLVEVPGVSNSNGEVISNLAVINEYGAEFGDYCGSTFIATTGETKAGGGSIFINTLDTIYKYNKTTLPINTTESGAHAVVSASGTLPVIGANNFIYDGYTNGGLSYTVYEEASSGYYMNQLSSSTLLPVPYRAELDIDSLDNPLFADGVDIDTLYTIENNDVYVFNIDDNSVAFCNVVSSEPVIPASSGYQTAITAHVVNLYGDPLQGKSVIFTVTAGGGSLSEAYVCTTSSGTASTLFTSDDIEGTSFITATATNTAC